MKLALLRTFALLLLSILAATLPSEARADYLQTYVAVTCDAASGWGMVRFGYGDADKPPRFIEVDPKIDGGLSKRPVEKASTDEAHCSLPGGREIKVRVEVNPRFGDSLERWSVWVDRIEVISGQQFDPPPFAVIIRKNYFGTCRFQLSETQSVYSLTEQSSESIAIECPNQTQISGARDLIEYPVRASK